MNLDKIIIVPKMSKLEWNAQTLGLTQKQVLEKWEDEGSDIDYLLECHNIQQEAKDIIFPFFKPEQIIDRNNLTREDVVNAELIISLGGDDHFTYVSHFVEDELIMGICADPKHSVGALLNYTPKEFVSIVEKLKQDKFEVENRPRLEALVNGKPILRATGAYYLGERERKNMSHHEIELNGIKEKQHGSGILVATQSGTTGWYYSASRYMHSEGIPDVSYAKFILTEPFGSLSDYQMLTKDFGPGENVYITSLCNHDPIITVDSLEEYNFVRGTKVVIKVGKPLKVVR